MSRAEGGRSASRSARSRASARVYCSRGPCANAGEGASARAHVTSSPATTLPLMLNTVAMIHPDIGSRRRSAQLRVDLVEVVLFHEHFASLTASRARHQPFGFHHVDEPGRAAEPDPQPPLQVRDRRLAARDDDPRRLVIQVVLLELEIRTGSLVILGDGLVVGRLALFAQEAGEARALLFGDIRAVQAHET